MSADAETGGGPATAEWSRQLLQSITDVARNIFGAAASSIFLVDEVSGELVFEAVSGKGEEFLVGTVFPAGVGIAGWVLASGEALVVDDAAASPLFARDLAASTRYIPDSIMAAPLVAPQGVLGVLEVLDPVPQSRSSLDELDLLTMFASQAAIALGVVAEYRTAMTALRSSQVAACTGLDAQGREISIRLVDAFRDFLGVAVRN